MIGEVNFLPFSISGQLLTEMPSCLERENIWDKQCPHKEITNTSMDEENNLGDFTDKKRTRC